MRSSEREFALIKIRRRLARVHLSSTLARYWLGEVGGLHGGMCFKFNCRLSHRSFWPAGVALVGSFFIGIVFYATKVSDSYLLALGTIGGTAGFGVVTVVSGSVAFAAWLVQYVPLIGTCWPPSSVCTAFGPTATVYVDPALPK